MKKPKISLSGASIKQFFLANGEKLGFGVALVVMALLVVSAIRKETLPADKSPEALQQLAIKMGKVIDDPNPIPPPVVHPVNWKIVLPLPKEESVVLEQQAKWPVPFKSPYRQDVDKRTAVAGLPLTGLRGYGDRGAIGLKGAAGGPAAPTPAPRVDKPVNPLLGQGGPVPVPVMGGQPVSNVIQQGRHFIMLTGIAPLADQQKEYDARFADAVHPTTADELSEGAKKIDRFHPEYWSYTVQRREVLPGGKFGPETDVDVKTAQADKDAWASGTQGGQEVANKDYVDPKLTFPLPPLLVKKWDERASHPLVPPKAADAPTTGIGDVMADPNKDAPAGDDVFDEGGKPKKKAVADNGPKIIPFKLFRFWDYSVEPDHAYQYRVQLVLINPNFRLHDRVLQDPAVAKTPFLQAPPSEWSAAISVPRDHQILAKSVEYGKDDKDKERKEVNAKVICWSWDNKEAVEAHQEFTMYRGDVANFTADVPAANSAGGNQTIKGFPFQPRMLLLDFRGGAQSAKEQAAQDADPAKHSPCELVFLDVTTNQLTTRRENQDAPILASFDSPGPEKTLGGGNFGGPPSPLAPPKGGLKLPPGVSDPLKLMIGPPSGTPDKAVDKTKGSKGK